MECLIVNFDNLGDVVFSSWISDYLSKYYDNISIDVLCSSYTKDIAECYPGVRKVFHLAPPWRSYFEHKKGPISDYLKIIQRIRVKKYDVLFCASPHWKDVLAVSAIRSNIKVGFQKRLIAKWNLTHPYPYPSKKEPILSSMNRLLKPIINETNHIKPFYRLDILESQNIIYNNLIVIHPFSSDVRKKWAIQNWILLAEKLRKTNILCWIGSKRDLDELTSKYPFLEQEIKKSNKIQSIKDTINLMTGMKLFIGHDSGPTHLAGALGGKGVALYPKYSSERYFPQGIGEIEMLVGDPINKIGVEQVYQLVLSKLLSIKEKNE